MKKIIPVVILLALMTSLFAQKQSILRNTALSAVVPGLGELMVGSNTKAGIFFTSEIGLLFSYISFNNHKNWAEDNYKQLAQTKMGVSKDNSDDYYQNLQKYKSSAVYNENVERHARNMYLIYYEDVESYEEYLNKWLIPEDQAWDWETDKNWLDYRQIRREKQDYEIYTKFTFAGLLLNRFVSMVDSAISTGKHNRKTDKFGKLNISPDFAKNGVRVTYEYKF
jgi:hypothetical protein